MNVARNDQDAPKHRKHGRSSAYRIYTLSEARLRCLSAASCCSIARFTSWPRLPAYRFASRLMALQTAFPCASAAASPAVPPARPEPCGDRAKSQRLLTRDAAMQRRAHTVSSCVVAPQCSRTMAEAHTHFTVSAARACTNWRDAASPCTSSLSPYSTYSSSSRNTVSSQLPLLPHTASKIRRSRKPPSGARAAGAAAVST